ncbi:Uncharacterised protein [Mycobacteroides abscessus subsp. massiliense]|nr:Uncharacterised protein [Mycobacteroides abscessus subsp. massiliense]
MRQSLTVDVAESDEEIALAAVGSRVDGCRDGADEVQVAGQRLGRERQDIGPLLDSGIVALAGGPGIQQRPADRRGGVLGIVGKDVDRAIALWRFPIQCAIRVQV